MDWQSIGTNDVTSFLVFGCVHGDMKTFQLASLVGMNATKTSCSSCQCDCGFEAGEKDIVEGALPAPDAERGGRREEQLRENMQSIFTHSVTSMLGIISRALHGTCLRDT